MFIHSKIHCTHLWHLLTFQKGDGAGFPAGLGVDGDLREVQAQQRVETFSPTNFNLLLYFWGGVVNFRGRALLQKGLQETQGDGAAIATQSMHIVYYNQRGGAQIRGYHTLGSRDWHTKQSCGFNKTGHWLEISYRFIVSRYRRFGISLWTQKPSCMMDLLL